MVAARLTSLQLMTGAVDFAPSCDPAGRAWLAELPTLVGKMCSRWGLSVEDDAVHHGYSAVVLPVQRDGTPLALKLAWPPGGMEEEARALRAWNGRGMALLVETDPASGAMVLERLEAGWTLMRMEPLKAARIAGALLRRLAIPAPAGFRDVRVVMADHARSLERQQAHADSPVQEGWLRAAIRLAHHLVQDADTTHLIHSDLHYDNILAGQREPWLAIDPRAMTGEPEQAVPELLWTRIDPEDSTEHILRILDTLVESAELRAERAREWVIVRCVDYWLWGVRHGLTEDPKRCRRILEAMEA